MKYSYAFIIFIHNGLPQGHFIPTLNAVLVAECHQFLKKIPKKKKELIIQEGRSYYGVIERRKKVRKNIEYFLITYPQVKYLRIGAYKDTTKPLITEDPNIST